MPPKPTVLPIPDGMNRSTIRMRPIRGARLVPGMVLVAGAVVAILDLYSSRRTRCSRIVRRYIGCLQLDLGLT